ncbi:putative F-box domain-containing protein [Rosa chinensis]|uniref:Putative F-box domain-containing protein n=1 Tax=Rosa chinensis TaxID=74649 RepID=A0A2P6PWB8_ROSCH|nr:putative F-box domain-containing protein [Rosa chinensis]
MRGEKDTTITSDSLVAPSQSLFNTIFLNICDLPNSLLIEILCRLPCKFVLRCKCVCKSWSTLISHPYFESRRALYLRNNCDNEQIPMFVVHSYPLADNTAELLTIDSNQTHAELRALDFLPSKLVVVATYNDLILLCEKTLGFQRKYYYICNPYTKQWVAVPPPPILFPQQEVGVGFIRDSDYRCRIVRLLEFDAEPDDFRLKVEMFSSETGKWIESVVLCPKRFRPHPLQQSAPALAYNGTLYWLGRGGILIGLEPFKLDNKNNHNYHCHFISGPRSGFPLFYDSYNYTDCLGVCRGCVRMCRLYTLTRFILFVWELKEDSGLEVDGVGGKKMKWCLKERIFLDQIKSQYMVPHPYWLLALDPNDEDMLYLLRRPSSSDPKDIVKCNIRTETLIDISPKLPLKTDVEAFPFMLSWWRWPTPVPKLGHHNNSSCPPQ